MKKLLFVFAVLCIASCNIKPTRYIITIPWEGSSYYYYTDSIKIDSVTKCVTFVGDPSSEENRKPKAHTLCGTYQITEN